MIFVSFHCPHSSCFYPPSARFYFPRYILICNIELLTKEFSFQCLTIIFHFTESFPRNVKNKSHVFLKQILMIDYVNFHMIEYVILSVAKDLHELNILAIHKGQSSRPILLFRYRQFKNHF